MKTGFHNLHEINPTDKCWNLKHTAKSMILITLSLSGNEFHFLFRNECLCVLSILKIYQNICEIQQNEIFIEIIYISNNENFDKLLTFWLVYSTDFTSKGLILILLIIAYNLILSESQQ